MCYHEIAHVLHEHYDLNHERSIMQLPETLIGKIITLKRLHHVETTNLRSLRAHQKYGFEIVGKLRKNDLQHYNMLLKQEPLPNIYVK